MASDILEEGAKIDRFATLFSPATPPASPILPPVILPSEPGPSRTQRAVHVRTQSVSSESDFGTFISVPPTDDPLASAAFSPVSPYSQSASREFFDKFAEGARLASERNKKDFLDELLEHEDDPLYLSLTDRADLPLESDQNKARSEALLDEDLAPGIEILVPTQEIPRSDSPLQQLSGESTPARAPTPSPMTHFLSSSPDTSTQSGAKVSRKMSITLPKTPTSRWMSTMLSLAQPVPASTSPPSSDGLPIAVPVRSPPETNAETSLHTHVAQVHAHSPGQKNATVDPARASTMPISTIYHGSPFAYHPFLPPTGAPGFSGDRNWDKGFFDDYETSKVAKDVILEGRAEATSKVLGETLANLIRLHLPALARLPSHWMLLYSLDQHGISLNTLYSQCDPGRNTKTTTLGALLVVRDANDVTFGAWISDGLHKGNGAYYGSGESFLWTYSGREEDGDHALKVFRWTGRNDYVALCEPDYISFGGGDGQYGLYLDDTLLGGTSASCPTFANEPLCSIEGGRKGSEDVAFECVGLEVWTVIP